MILQELSRKTKILTEQFKQLCLNGRKLKILEEFEYFMIEYIHK